MDDITHFCGQNQEKLQAPWGGRQPLKALLRTRYHEIVDVNASKKHHMCRQCASRLHMISLKLTFEMYTPNTPVT